MKPTIRIAAGAALIFAAGFAAGSYVERQWASGYDSVADCILGEGARQPDPRYMGPAIVQYCSRYR